jgi:hypothetical protein
LSREAEEATRDHWTWLRRYTKTYNEHWKEEGRTSPYESFPDWEYIPDLLELFRVERIIAIEKSRDLMVSWVCVGFLTLEAQTVPERGIIFQTQKEKKVKQLIRYAKTLYRMQPRWLQECFPLWKPVERQSDLELRWANGSWIMGIPGGGDQIRSYHPWGYLSDETAFQPEAGECYDHALAAAHKIILNSSAGPGWYAQFKQDAVLSSDDE